MRRWLWWLFDDDDVQRAMPDIEACRMAIVPAETRTAVVSAETRTAVVGC